MNYFLTVLTTFLFQINIISCDFCISIEKILNNEKVINYLHLEEKDRNVIYLKPNKFCNMNGKIINNKLKISLLSEENKNKSNILIIRDVEVKDKNKFDIILEYPIEGVIIKASILNDEVTSLEIIER